MRTFAITLLVLASALAGHAVSADCLTDAAAFANRICGEVSNRGKSALINASGELNAEARGLIKQLLGSAGGELKGETEFTSYENVLREQLANELVNVRQCGIRMAEAAMQQVCSKPVTFKSCQHPDFGLAGWRKEETLQGTSGWRGGGYNQGAYCSDYTNSVVSSRKLTGTDYKIEKVTSGEEGRWTGTFGRDRQYNYHCTLKVYSDPIYNERTDARCGILDTANTVGTSGSQSPIIQHTNGNVNIEFKMPPSK
jgi:hypothetical protein